MRSTSKTTYDHTQLFDRCRKCGMRKICPPYCQPKSIMCKSYREMYEERMRKREKEREKAKRRRKRKRSLKKRYSAFRKEKTAHQE